MPVIDAPRIETGAATDQVSRIEDKTARIEEKFARSEERMMRLESALEKATLRLEGASQDMNLQGVRDDIARLRDQVGKKPGAVTIFVIALIAALIGAGVAFALARYGIPFLPR
jgi:predicted  nucleic acid-binding Zn-ribbon protein